MTRLTDLQRTRQRGLLFVPATQRRDNCAGCRHSRSISYDTGMYCHLTRGVVSGGSVCAAWKPVVKWLAVAS